LIGVKSSVNLEVFRQAKNIMFQQIIDLIDKLKFPDLFDPSD
jgi:hypothetical protein